MEPMEIFLVIAGVVMVTVTYILSEKFEMGSSDIDGEISNNARKITEELVREEVKNELANVIDDKVEDVRVELDKIANEKLLAVGNYSDEILSSINKNHNEVMFLYNMLNEKETELKDTIRDIEALKLSIKKMMVVSEMAVSKDKKPVEKFKIQSEAEEPKTEEGGEAVDKNVSVEPQYEEGANKNQEILKMHESGKSNIEIAKLMGIGLGEVRLVIDLFKKES